MELGLSEEQILLGDAIGQICADQFPLSALRAQEKRGEPFPVPLWQALSDMGIGGMVIPEERGGLGMGMLDVAVAYERFGHHLLSSPHWVSALVAGPLLLAAGDEATAAAWLPHIIDGGRILSLASREPGRGREDRPGDTRLTRLDGGWRLDGRKVFVPFAQQADGLLVLAGDGNRLVVCLVPPDAPGVTITPQPNLGGEAYGTVGFDGVTLAAGQVLAGGTGITEAWRATMFAALVPLAARAVGAARHIHDISIAYAKERQAFGRPIGGFQAIAHDLAEAAVAIEGCRTLVHQAAWLHDRGRPFHAVAAMAKLQACSMFRRVSALGVQVHGGLGYTMEADPQLFFRRAKQWQVLDWDDARLEDEIAALTLDGTHGDV